MRALPPGALCAARLRQPALPQLPGHQQPALAGRPGPEVLPPIPYFHLVFTLPHELNPLIRQNQQALYDLLFASRFGDAAELRAQQPGRAIGRHGGAAHLEPDLAGPLPPALHRHGRWALSGRHALGRLPPGLPVQCEGAGQVFRAKFCEGLQALYAEGRLQFHGSLAGLAAAPKFQALVRQATRHSWVVYSKRPFAGPQQVLAYLSRYTHRVGITNARLQRLDRAAGTVTFDYKDYADGARHKAMTLSLEQFIGRLCLHLLPPRFVKIRHYGLLSNRGHNRRLEQARALLAKAPAAPLPQPSPNLLEPKLAVPGAWPICPHCGWATLVLVRVVQPQRWVAPVAATDTS